MVISSFAFLIFSVYWFMVLKKIEQDQYPLILVDGKMAPRLSPLSFHINKSDFSCMSCHANDQKFSLKGKKYYSKKIPHMYRENCISCHILEI